VLHAWDRKQHDPESEPKNLDPDSK
jgi:hypothetical protein